MTVDPTLAAPRRRRAPRSAGRRWPSVTGIARLCATGYIAASVAWLLSWLALGDGLPDLGYVHANAFLIGLGLLPAILVALGLRRWWWAATGTLILGTLIATGSGLNPGAGIRPRAAGTIRIVSASLRSLNPDMTAAADRLATYAPDILVLQEVSDVAAFRRRFDLVTGIRWQVRDDHGFAVLARESVTPTLSPGSNWREYSVALPGRRLSVWDVHAPKNYSHPTENKVFFFALHDAIRIRRPDIVAGDFNATPWNDGYRTIATIMTDAHRVAGFGPGNSFPAGARRSGRFGAFMRIDHIFTGARLRASNAFVGTASAGADHQPIVSDFRIDGVTPLR